MAGRFVNGDLTEGSDRGTLYVSAGAKVHVVGSVTNTASGAFTGPSVWNLDPFTTGATERNTTSSVDVTWTNAGATRFVAVQMFDNSSFSNATRFSFSFAVQGSQPGSCQAPINGGPVLPGEVLGGSSSRSIRNVACAQGQATNYPVTTSTGNFWHSFGDLAIPGRGFSLAFGRTYNSYPGTSVPDGPLGFGWSFTYGVSLSIATSSVTLTEEGGSQVVFSGSGPTYTAPPRVIASLQRDVPSPGMYTLTRQAQEKLVFNSSGQLVSQVDLNGYATNLAYSAGKLASITDSGGRKLFLTWVGSHIKTVSDADQAMPGRRIVTFSYGSGDTGPDLTEVLDANSPRGRTVFTYDSNHRLRTMREPKYFADTTTVPPPVVTNSYDPSGRVEWQSDQLGRTTSFDYDSVPGSTIVIEPSSQDVNGATVTHVTLDTYEQGVLFSQTRGYGTPQAATWQRRYDPNTLGCTSVVDPNLQIERAIYDERGNRTSQTDALGRITRFTYNSLNQITTLTEPKKFATTAVTTTWSYDTAGNLLSRSTPLLDAAGATLATSTTSYRHEDATRPGDVTSMTDPMGNVWAYTYDSFGNVSVETAPPTPENPAGNKTGYNYDAVRGWLTSEVSPKGNLAGANAATYTTVFGRDPLGKLTTVTDPLKNRSTRLYDANHNLKSLTDADGNTTTYVHDPANQLIETKRGDGTVLRDEYWANGAKKTQIDASLQPTRYSYDALYNLASTKDPLGRTTAYVYDAVGNLKSKADPAGNCGATPKLGCTTYTHDAADQLKTVTYSDGTTPNVTAIAYDANGRRTSMTSGTQTSTWAWDSLQRLTTNTQGGGEVVGYGYDLNGQVTSIAYPNGAGTVTRGFDAAGRLDRVSDWLSHTTPFTYDENSNLVTQQAPSTPAITDTYRYDAADRLYSIALSGKSGFLYGRDPNGQVSSVQGFGTGTGEASRAYSYSALNQVVTPGRIGVVGAQVSNSLAVRPNGSVLAWGANDSGQLGTPLPGDQATPSQVAGLPAVTAVAAGQLESYSVALAADGGVWAWGANSAGQLGIGTTATTSTPTRVKNSTGGNLGSVVAVAAGGSHSVALTSTGRVWTWGSNTDGELGLGTADTSAHATATQITTLPNMVAIAAGRSHTMALGADGTLWSWGRNDRGQLGLGDTTARPAPVKVTGVAPISSISAGSAHSLLRAVDGTVYAAGDNTWGQLGRAATTAAEPTFTQIAALAGAIQVAAGGEHSLAFKAGGSLLAWGRNNFGQLGLGSVDSLPHPTPTRLTTLIGVVAVAAGLNHTVATKDRGTVWAWGDNTHGQLGVGDTAARSTPTLVDSTTGLGKVEVTRPYAYDAADNLTQQPSGAIQAYDAANQLCSSTPLGTTWGTCAANPPANVTTYAYDGRGNRTNKVVHPATALSTTTYSYDQANRLNLVDAPDVGGVATSYGYSYDGDGLRMTKTKTLGTTNSTTAFAWDTSSSVPLLLAEGNTYYVYGPGGLPLQQIKGTDVLYYHHDQLGSTRTLTDSLGKVAATYAYDAYGNVASSSVSSDHSGLSNPFGYAGQYTDAETGFQYLRARYYDPATGQFLTRDPLEPVTGTPYAYANNSPLNFTDPSGEIAWFAAAALAWGAFEVGSAVVDAVSTAKTLTDRCASGLDKLISGGLFAASIGLPGGGYSTGARAARGADDIIAGRNLGRQLASEEQLGQAGRRMAGAGTRTTLRNASRLASQYGGSANDWVKMSSSSYRGADGFQFETHWYENIRTRQRVEFKTNF